MSAPTVTPEGRDALYEQIIVGLSGIGDVWTAIEAEDYDTAERLGRAYCDDLQLVLDDLGWGGGPGSEVELRTPVDVLRRALNRLRDIARSQNCTDEKLRAEAQEAQEHNRIVIETCETVLAGLEGKQGR